MTFGFKTFTLLLHMQFFNLHTHKFTNNASVFELVNQYPWEFDSCIPNFSIGIHPWYINKERLESDLKTIEDKLKLEECLALGECGLDKRIEVPMTFQIDVFEQDCRPTTNQLYCTKLHGIHDNCGFSFCYTMLLYQNDLDNHKFQQVLQSVPVFYGAYFALGMQQKYPLQYFVVYLLYL